MEYAEMKWGKIEIQSRAATEDRRCAIAIISAALKRQREECGVVAMNALGWGHYNPRFNTILNAEVDAPADSEVKHGS